MLIEAARRAEAAVKEMLALVNEGSAPCAEIREALAVSKAIAGINSAFQVAGAADVAGRERHGDGGTEILAGAAGMSRREARSQVKTAEALRQAPRLRDAVAQGRVSVANTRRLAEAVEKAGAANVESDSELLAKAETLRPEQFTKEARRWTVERQEDSGASEHARQRARRRVRIWNADDGMVHLYGQFDTVTGQRICSRLRADAARMLDADNKNADKHTATDSSSGPQRRSFDQCMADALDNLTSNSARSGGGEPYADICVVAHVDEATGELIAQLPDGDRLPPSVLEELACDARLTGVIYDRKGRPIWRTHPRRRATEAQRQMLIARDGGCFACGTDVDMCDIHHVEPVSQGGPTSLDNLVLACWQHHTAVHHFGWQIHGPPGNRTLHPPNTINHGPARTPDQPIPNTPHAPSRPTPATAANSTPVSSSAKVAYKPQPGLATATDGTHRNTQPADAAATHKPGPAAARAVLRSARPTPLFAPD